MKQEKEGRNFQYEDIILLVLETKILRTYLSSTISIYNAICMTRTRGKNLRHVALQYLSTYLEIENRSTKYLAGKSQKKIYF